MTSFRIERDSMGEMQVPAEAYYGAQTARAVENFPISTLRFGRSFIRALALVKLAAAKANSELGLLSEKKAEAHANAVAAASAQQVARGPLGLTDVAQMAQQHISDEVIITHIRTNGVVYHLSAAEIEYLKASGVSDAVVIEMQATANRVPRRRNASRRHRHLAIHIRLYWPSERRSSSSARPALQHGSFREALNGR